MGGGKLGGDGGVHGAGERPTQRGKSRLTPQ